jgi:hypothetical protein
MRTRFLDFDGVLHPLTDTHWFELRLPLAKTIARGRLFRWTWPLAELLEDHPEVQIIVHSSWRNFMRDPALKALLGPLEGRYAGATPRVDRWNSIQHVIAEKQLQNYCILDDRASEFPADLPELILCDPEEGVYDAAVRDKLRAWLAAEIR